MFHHHLHVCTSKIPVIDPATPKVPLSGTLVILSVWKSFPDIFRKIPSSISTVAFQACKKLVHYMAHETSQPNIITTFCSSFPLSITMTIQLFYYAVRPNTICDEKYLSLVSTHTDPWAYFHSMSECLRLAKGV